MKAVLCSITIALLVPLADAANKNHTCIPTGQPNLCLLEYVYYTRNQTTVHTFPKGYSHISIGNCGWSKGTESVIHNFDLEFYAQLGRPQAVEIMNVMMDTLEIPRALRLGNFADNFLKWFSIEQAEAAPELVYLDLESNYLSNLTNISGLVNLETLYLQSNRIEALEKDHLKPLTKLKILNLNFNQIYSFSGRGLPHSLTDLGLSTNSLTTLNYSDLYMPSLEMLNIESNELQTIDVSALMLALPKLRTIRLSENSMRKDTLLPILQEFDRHNVSYKNEGYDPGCNYQHTNIEGICVMSEYVGQGWFKSTALSILTVLIAVVFVLTVRWVYIAMNK